MGHQKMRRDLAERTIDAVKRIDLILDELDLVTNELDDEVERRKMRRALGSLVIDIHENITLEVVKQFPDLHPDREHIEEMRRRNATPEGESGLS
jgi:hypothetical protein